MSKNNTLEKILKNSNKAMILGIGGGGDIVGTLPTVSLLKLFDIDYILGGLTWERSVIDPVPGPRKFDEIQNAKKLNDTVFVANKDTMTTTGVKFAESGVAEVLNTETLLIDINQGAKKVAEGVLDAASKFDIDLILGIDVGGDAIALGHEEGIASPLADSIMTASLAKLSENIVTVMGLFGFGSDGELSFSQLEESLKIIAMNGGILGSWGITNDTLKLMEDVIKVVPTEASRIPVEYAKGTFKQTKIRSGMREVDLNIASTVTFYFDPMVVYRHVSKPAREVAECESLDEAKLKLNKMGLSTELDLELKKSEIL